MAKMLLSAKNRDSFVEIWEMGLFRSVGKAVVLRLEPTQFFIYLQNLV